jgi:DNA-binding Xre family transcriptional regulator
MNKKSFQDYLEKRLTSAEITEIERHAQFEKHALHTLQTDVALALDVYMKKENIGLEELAQRLHVSPTQVAKIKKGEANLTLLSLARLAALLEQGPHLIFTKQNSLQ